MTIGASALTVLWGIIFLMAAVGIIYLLTIRLPRRRKRLRQRDGPGTLVSGTTHRHDHHQ